MSNERQEMKESCAAKMGGLNLGGPCSDRHVVAQHGRAPELGVSTSQQPQTVLSVRLIMVLICDKSRMPKGKAPYMIKTGVLENGR
jgi:hypothetical protein